MNSICIFAFWNLPFFVHQWYLHKNWWTRQKSKWITFSKKTVDVTIDKSIDCIMSTPHPYPISYGQILDMYIYFMIKRMAYQKMKRCGLSALCYLAFFLLILGEIHVVVGKMITNYTLISIQSPSVSAFPCKMWPYVNWYLFYKETVSNSW